MTTRFSLAKKFCPAFATECMTQNLLVVVVTNKPNFEVYYAMLLQQDFNGY